MRRKKNNNLILLTIGKKKYYYTSITRVGYKLAIASASVSWAINHGNVLTNENNEKVTIKIIDGSDIQYKYINND